MVILLPAILVAYGAFPAVPMPERGVVPRHGIFLGSETPAMNGERARSMAVKGKVQKIADIFISTTALDCKPFRMSVKDAVERRIPSAKVHLQEQWLYGAADPVYLSEKRFNLCHAYMGVFGYRYGWEPSGAPPSITEMEFTWARERWEADRDPPFFIFLPKDGSPADTTLKAQAQAVLAEKDFPDAPEKAGESLQKQQVFLSAVKGWMKSRHKFEIPPYETESELRELAISSVLNWNCELLYRAPDKRFAATNTSAEADLGGIGREVQCEALESAVTAFRRQKAAPAMAILVHGPENWGQRHFAQYLTGWPHWQDAPVRLGLPPDPVNPDALIRWTFGFLSLPCPAAPDIDALATALVGRLADGPLVMILQNIGARDERLALFANGFWAPLLAALGTRLAGHDDDARLYCVVVDHQSLPAGGNSAVWGGSLRAPNLDYSRLLPLPPLGEISFKQVKDWLKAQVLNDGGTLDLVECEDIAERATGADSLPSNVYDRLARESIWARIQ
jgi:hypothetical protein